MKIVKIMGILVVINYNQLKRIVDNRSSDLSVNRAGDWRRDKRKYKKRQKRRIF